MNQRTQTFRQKRCRGKLPPPKREATSASREIGASSISVTMAVIKLDIMVNEDKLSQPQARTRLEECGKNDIIGLSQGAPLSARHAASRVHRNVADSYLRIIGGKMKIE